MHVLVGTHSIGCGEIGYIIAALFLSLHDSDPEPAGLSIVLVPCRVNSLITVHNSSRVGQGRKS